MQMIAAGVALFLVATLSGEWSRFDIAAVTWKSWLSVAYLSILGSVVALSAYVWLLKVSTSARVSTYAYVNPVIAVVLGALFASEPITPRAVVAAVVIVSAVVMITRGSRRTVAQTTPEPGERNTGRPALERVSALASETYTGCSR